MTDQTTTTNKDMTTTGIKVVVKRYTEETEWEETTMQDALDHLEGYWKPGTIQEMLEEGEAVWNPFAIYKMVWKAAQS